MPLPSIGLIAEGYTDQIVIEQILIGLLRDGDEEPDINFAQPVHVGTDANGTYAPGGWTVLFDYLRRGEHRKALQFNEFIVIHVDTDVCEDVGFDVQRCDDQGPRNPEQLADLVETRLKEVMGADFAQYADRVVFAIAVETVECWLLPLVFPTEKAKRSKTTGCIQAVDDELRRRGLPRIKSSTGKDGKAYGALAKGYAKRKGILKHRAHNPSLERFVTAVERACKPE